VILSAPACSLRKEIFFPEQPLRREVQPGTDLSLLSDWDLDFIG